MSSKSFVLVAMTALAIPSVSFAQAVQHTPDATVTKLEKAQAKKPQDPAIARALGIAYYKNERYAEARPHLETAVRLDPRDGAAALYLGLTAEQQKDIPGAKSAYQTYAKYGKTSKV